MHDFARAAADRGQHFFYVLIRESIGPEDRGEKYEDPLAQALRSFGKVTGGGSQMGEGNSIAFCGIDIVVNDREVGLEIIRNCLRRCDAPSDTVIEEYIPEFTELRLNET